jgi:hypothetical protein
MTEIVEPEHTSYVIGYPSEDNKNAENVPEGLCLNVLDQTQSVTVTPLIRDANFYKSIIRYSCFLKFMSMVDLFTNMMSIYKHRELLALFISMPLIGYFGAKYYHKSLICSYGLYLFFLILMKLVFILFETNNKHIIKYSVVIVVYFVVLVVVVIYARILCMLTKYERVTLRTVQYCYADNDYSNN